MENNKQVNNQYNNILTKKIGWIIGTYFLGISPMIFLYGLFNMYLSPSLKYMNIMLSSIVFYYFGFIELTILVISLAVLYLNNNYDLIKNKISKILFFYNSLKKANTLDTPINPEFEIVGNIINKINKYENTINKYIQYIKQININNTKSTLIINKLTFLNKYINKLENILNIAYDKIKNISKNMILDIKESTYITKKIEPVINVINDVVYEKNDIEMQDEYIDTKRALEMIKNDINNIDDINNILDDKSILDNTNQEIIDEKIIDEKNIDEEITNKFIHMEKELKQFDDLINELNKLDTEINKPPEKMSKEEIMGSEEIMKSLDLMNLFGKMMKITELEPGDKEKCKKKIKEEIMDSTEFMNLLNNSFC